MRAEPLRRDALAAKFAGFAEYDRAFILEMVVDGQTWGCSRSIRWYSGLALLSGERFRMAGGRGERHEVSSSSLSVYGSSLPRGVPAGDCAHCRSARRLHCTPHGARYTRASFRANRSIVGKGYREHSGRLHHQERAEAQNACTPERQAKRASLPNRIQPSLLFHCSVDKLPHYRLFGWQNCPVIDVSGNEATDAGVERAAFLERALGDFAGDLKADDS